MSVTYKTFEDLRNEVIALGEEWQRLKKQEEDLTKKLQESCTHAAVVETPFLEGCFNISFDRRICVLCGLEDVWRIGGFKILGNREPIRIIEDREEFLRFRTLQPLKTITVPEGLFENKE